MGVLELGLRSGVYAPYAAGRVFAIGDPVEFLLPSGLKRGRPNNSFTAETMARYCSFNVERSANVCLNLKPPKQQGMHARHLPKTLRSPSIRCCGCALPLSCSCLESCRVPYPCPCCCCVPCSELCLCKNRAAEQDGNSLLKEISTEEN